MKTYIATKKDLSGTWYLIDASGMTLGHLASKIAFYLRGKHKPVFTPGQDVGDFFVVTNASQIVVTGNKKNEKGYYRYTGYPGGIKLKVFSEMQKASPEKILQFAVQGMLPKGPLGRKVFKKLKIYSDSIHPHAAQKPQKVLFDKKNGISIL